MIHGPNVARELAPAGLRSSPKSDTDARVILACAQGPLRGQREQAPSPRAAAWQ